LKLLVEENANIWIVIVKAFFSGKGGAERFVFYIPYDFSFGLYIWAVKFNFINPDYNNSFSRELFAPHYELIYLQKNIDIPVMQLIKRYFFMKN